MKHWAFLVVGKAEFDAPSLRSQGLRPNQSAVRVASKQTASELAERRAAALRGFFPKLASWFESAMDRARRNEVEAYLSHATDIADLEERMRQLQRREMFARYY